MNKQTLYGDRIKAFKKARAEFDDSVKAVAEKFGYSDRYIYQVLKYPNENPELYKRIAQYVEDAGERLPEANLEQPVN